MKKARSFGRSRSLGLGGRALPPDPPAGTADYDGFRWSTEVSRSRQQQQVQVQRQTRADEPASPPRLAASAKDTPPVSPERDNKIKTSGKWKAVADKASGQTYYYHTATKETTWNKPGGFVEKKGVAKWGNSNQKSVNNNKKEEKSGRTKRQGATPNPADAPGYGKETSAQIQTEGRTTSSNANKHIRSVSIPKKEARSVLTDEMSDLLHQHMTKSSQKGKVRFQDDNDDVSALVRISNPMHSIIFIYHYVYMNLASLFHIVFISYQHFLPYANTYTHIIYMQSMGTAGREFYGWEERGAKSKSGVFLSFGRMMKKGGRQGKKNGKATVSAYSKGRSMVGMGAISESNERMEEEEIATRPRTKAKGDSHPKPKAEDQLFSASSAASNPFPGYKKGISRPAERSSPPPSRVQVSANSSGELLRLNDTAYTPDFHFAESYDEADEPTVDDVLADLVQLASSPVGKVAERQIPPPAWTKEEQPPKVSRSSQAIGSLNQSADVSKDKIAQGDDGELPLSNNAASYDSLDNTLLQKQVSFLPAPKMATADAKPSSSGDKYIDAYKGLVDMYIPPDSKTKSGSPARSTKSSATAETLASSQPNNSSARTFSVGAGSSSAGDKKSKSSSLSSSSPKVALKNLVRLPSLKARSMGRSPSFKAVFSANKASNDDAWQKTASAGVPPVGIDQDVLAQQRASLDDDIYTAAAKASVAKVNTFDTADTAPSKNDYVSSAISDLFCAFDLDTICQPGRTRGGASQTLDTSLGTSYLKTPTSQAASSLTGSDCYGESAMPRMPNFAQQSAQSPQFSVYGSGDQIQWHAANP